MRIAVVTPRMASGERGGAEVLYRGVISALRDAGHETEQVAVLYRRTDGNYGVIQPVTDRSTGPGR